MLISGGDQQRESVAEETAEFAPAEAIVGAFVVSIVGDHTVVASLGRLVGDDDRALVGATSALGHAALLLCLHLAHALLRLAHVLSLVVAHAGLVSLAADKLEEALTLLGSSRFI